MALTTYSELKAALANWLNRSDLTATIPDFVALAEVQMARKLRCRKMVGRSEATLSAGAEFLEVPARFVGPLTFILETDPITRLKYVDPDNFNAIKASDRDCEGSDPIRYTVVGEEFQIGPVPDEEFTVELTFWQKPQALSDAVASNWVLENYPDIYLYGALVQAAPYLMDDARTAVWATLFNQAIAEANADDPLPTSETTLRIDDMPFGMSGYFNINTGL